MIKSFCYFCKCDLEEHQRNGGTIYRGEYESNDVLSCEQCENNMV